MTSFTRLREGCSLRTGSYVSMGFRAALERRWIAVCSILAPLFYDVPECTYEALGSLCFFRYLMSL